MSERLYFDCNATFGPHPRKNAEARWTKEHLIGDMDLAGIAGALVSYTQCVHYDPMLGNRTLIDLINNDRRRLFPCWVAMPSVSGDFPDVATFMSELRRNDVRAVRVDAAHFGLPVEVSVWKELRDALLAENVLVILPINRFDGNFDPTRRLLRIFDRNKTLLVNHGWGQWRQIVCLMNEFENLHI